jgi:hypothetical protein
MLTPPVAFARARADRGMSAKRRYLGSWTLPSGNSCNVFLSLPLPPRGEVAVSGLVCEWDVPPSPTWPAVDVEHYQHVTWPAILHAVASATGKRVLGVRA